MGEGIQQNIALKMEQEKEGGNRRQFRQLLLG